MSEELAWQAGVFETRGWIFIHEQKLTWSGQLTATVTSPSEEITRRFYDVWGGYHKLQTTDGRLPYWRWRVTGHEAATFLTGIRTYLRTETFQARADLGVEYQHAKQSRAAVTHSDAYQDRMRHYRDRMRKLNDTRPRWAEQ